MMVKWWNKSKSAVYGEEALEGDCEEGVEALQL